MQLSLPRSTQVLPAIQAAHHRLVAQQAVVADVTMSSSITRGTLKYSLK